MAKDFYKVVYSKTTSTKVSVMPSNGRDKLILIVRGIDAPSFTPETQFYLSNEAALELVETIKAALAPVEETASV
jgi:acetaldehyde dehydrogenase (acetylating)